MADQFDPYYTWLAIPPEDQPPNHYRLLGVKEFESNPDVISNAADRQMSHVRTFQTGAHSAESQRLLNEIAGARVCLLNDKQRGSYDTNLRAKQKPAAAQRAVAAAQPAVAVAARPRPVAKATAAAAAPTATAASRPAAKSPETNFGGAAPTIVLSSDSLSRRRGKSLQNGIIAAAVIGIAIGAVVVFLLRDTGGAGRNSELSHKSADKTSTKTPATAPVVKSGKPPVPEESAPPPDPGEKTTVDVTLPAKTGEEKTPVKTSDEPEYVPTSRPPMKTPDTPVEPPDTPVKTAPETTPPETKTGDAPPRKTAPQLPTLPGATDDPSLPAERPAKRLAVPPAAELQAKSQVVQEIYKDQLAQVTKPVERAKLAQDMLAKAEATKDDPVGRYALLTEALRQASEAGDSTTVLKTIQSTWDMYELPLEESMRLTLDSLNKAEKVNTLPGDKATLVTNALQLIEPAITKDRYTEAREMLAIARRAVVKAKDSSLGEQVAEATKRLQRLEKAFETAAPAKKTLEATPDDPAANLALGKYYAFIKDDWDLGLPYLAKCGDTELMTLSTKDIARPTSAEERAKLGDGWWTLAEQKAHAEAKSALQGRAADWYRLAQPELQGLTKVQVDKRLEELDRASGGKERDVVIRVVVQVPYADEFQVDASQLRWQHRGFDNWPAVRINNINWSPSRTNPAMPAKSIRGLREGMDFSRARLVKRAGRGEVRLTPGTDSLTVMFLDNGPGGDLYDVIITIPR